MFTFLKILSYLLLSENIWVITCLHFVQVLKQFWMQVSDASGRNINSNISAGVFSIFFQKRGRKLILYGGHLSKYQKIYFAKLSFIFKFLLPKDGGTEPLVQRSPSFNNISGFGIKFLLFVVFLKKNTLGSIPFVSKPGD